MPKYNPDPTNLEKARRAARLTRKKFAELSGVSMRTIAGYEQRRKNINNARAVIVSDLADALGVPVRTILNPRTEDDD